MPLFCRKNMTPLQRRSMQLMGSAMLFTVLTNFSNPGLPNPLLDVFPFLARYVFSRTPAAVVAVSVLAVLPVLFAVWVAARYLQAEPDEFVRALVVRALLWGIAVTMAGDAVAGALMSVYGRPFPLAVLNADLFFVATGIAFRLVQWSYR
jgi:hypothetical protein